MPDPAEDLTLDELREKLILPVAEAAAFDGWSADAVANAADDLGIDRDVAAFAFRGGQMDMIEAWIASVDSRMAAAAKSMDMSSMTIRDRIRGLVLARLDAVAGLEESLRRALAVMAIPTNVPRSVELGWRSADRMWRLAGDTSTDYNYYTKRTILAGIYAATLAIFVDDESEGKAETRAFLDRRLEGVMRFEKAKAQLLRPREDRFSMARFLGRLRYPAS